MMNSQGSGPAHYNYSVDPGEATGCGRNGGGADEGFLDMFGDRRSSGDLFDLVWQGRAGATSSIMEVQPSHLIPSLPPSEGEKAAWLCPVVRGDELVDSMGERRKKAIGGVRKSHHSEAHNLTKKRRRCRINEKFKILQQLVPGCDKSNQVSTLDQTIQYMNSLQQQIQEMSFGCDVKPFAVYPVVPPQYLPPDMAAGLMPPATAAPGVLLGGPVRPGVVHALPPAMIPFGPALLPLVHHHPAAAMASSPMMYPAPAVRNNSTSQNKNSNLIPQKMYL
ncbi:hypothetical protein GQ55_3G461200 [Panicum hallii var. hallii]|uniref:BHLH domain-containing protein n=1 Tax=Panicum hallii var. hallii TaxID=1504633 RepID=A0A2T7EIY7_9POAL|nr:hypothetical protein GQ55_3G461200 [Panicum hallii var. hallii]